MLLLVQHSTGELPCTGAKHKHIERAKQGNARSSKEAPCWVTHINAWQCQVWQNLTQPEWYWHLLRWLMTKPPHGPPHGAAPVRGPVDDAGTAQPAHHSQHRACRTPASSQHHTPPITSWRRPGQHACVNDKHISRATAPALTLHEVHIIVHTVIGVASPWGSNMCCCGRTVHGRHDMVAAVSCAARDGHWHLRQPIPRPERDSPDAAPSSPAAIRDLAPADSHPDPVSPPPLLLPALLPSKPPPPLPLLPGRGAGGLGRRMPASNR